MSTKHDDKRTYRMPRHRNNLIQYTTYLYSVHTALNELSLHKFRKSAGFVRAANKRVLKHPSPSRDCDCDLMNCFTFHSLFKNILYQPKILLSTNKEDWLYLDVINRFVIFGSYRRKGLDNLKNGAATASPTLIKLRTILRSTYLSVNVTNAFCVFRFWEVSTSLIIISNVFGVKDVARSATVAPPCYNGWGLSW